MSDHKANAEALDIALYGTPDIYTPPEEFMPRRASIAEKLAELYPDRDAVDHKAEAEAIDLRTLADQAADANGRGIIAALDAVRHATLYAAEQQRIANLIEVGRDRDKQLDRELNDPNYRVLDGSTLTVSAPTELLDRSNEIKAQIREGLGVS